MNVQLSKQPFLIKHYELLIYFGLLSGLSIFNVADLAGNKWTNYLTILFYNSIVFAPAFVFSWNREHLLSPGKFTLAWLLCYLVAVPVCTGLCMLIVPSWVDRPLFALGGLWCLSLELLLNANQFYQKKVHNKKWVQKIGLENAVLISIIIFTVTISFMAVSSYHDPKYHTKEQLLVGYEFKPLKLFKYFGTFISFFIQFLIIYLAGYIFFFINSRYLVSKILRQKGLIIYVLSLFTTIALLYPAVAQLLIVLPINNIFGRLIFSEDPFILENALGALAIMVISLPIILSIQWAKQNTRIISLEKEKTQTELDLLKQQLDPHFFFNTLNNLYALSLQKSDRTPDSILQLSALMRYVIYKGQEKFVPLSQELNYIDDYINLQQIRLKWPIEFSFSKQIANEDTSIAPLLLIVLIENAFKHGIEPAAESAILKIDLVNDDSKLYFSVENSYESPDMEKKPGIGLANLKRRLELLYPEQHVLQSNDNNGIFKTALTIYYK
ncbi:MAG: hypothetical protein EOO89_14710 [Pedobacter sp.]|nr:MAG: hypothetical protein EOO89_14710 [Pedobacter sp.]